MLCEDFESVKVSASGRSVCLINALTQTGTWNQSPPLPDEPLCPPPCALYVYVCVHSTHSAWLRLNVEQEAQMGLRRGRFRAEEKKGVCRGGNNRWTCSRGCGVSLMAHRPHLLICSNYQPMQRGGEGPPLPALRCEHNKSNTPQSRGAHPLDDTHTSPLWFPTAPWFDDAQKTDVSCVADSGGRDVVSSTKKIKKRRAEMPSSYRLVLRRADFSEPPPIWHCQRLQFAVISSPRLPPSPSLRRSPPTHAFRKRAMTNAMGRWCFWSPQQSESPAPHHLWHAHTHRHTHRHTPRLIQVHSPTPKWNMPQGHKGWR